MRLTSPAFDDGGRMPGRYTAPDANELPTLRIDDVPSDARSLAVVLEDLDSPLGTVTHWLAWNIPPDTRELSTEGLPEGSCEGLGTFGEVGYFGPAPAEGQHRYCFRLFAVARMLDLKEGAKRPDLDKALEGHILKEARLTGCREAPPACNNDEADD